MPLMSAAVNSSGIVGSTPSPATPPPASSKPKAISHGIERRSARCPIAGWITDDDIAWHSSSVPAVWCDRCRLRIRYGSSAGMKLWLTSSARCAVASKAMERTSRRDTSPRLRRAAVDSVEHGGPRRAAVARCLPPLSHRTVGARRERDAVGYRLAVATAARSGEHHRAVLQAAVEIEDAAAVVHPRLVPHLARSVVVVETRTLVAAGAGPVLLQHAAAVFARDVVGAGGLAGRVVGDVPAPGPKIELPVLRRRAAFPRCGGCGEREQRERERERRECEQRTFHATMLAQRARRVLNAAQRRV